MKKIFTLFLALFMAFSYSALAQTEAQKAEEFIKKLTNEGIEQIINADVSQKDKDVVMKHINRFYVCYEIGEVEKGDVKVRFENRMSWL